MDFELTSSLKIIYTYNSMLVNKKTRAYKAESLKNQRRTMDARHEESFHSKERKLKGACNVNHRSTNRMMPQSNWFCELFFWKVIQIHNYYRRLISRIIWWFVVRLLHARICNSITYYIFPHHFMDSFYLKISTSLASLKFSFWKKKGDSVSCKGPFLFPFYLLTIFFRA